MMPRFANLRDGGNLHGWTEADARQARSAARRMARVLFIIGGLSFLWILAGG